MEWAVRNSRRRYSADSAIMPYGGARLPPNRRVAAWPTALVAGHDHLPGAGRERPAVSAWPDRPVVLRRPVCVSAGVRVESAGAGIRHRSNAAGVNRCANASGAALPLG